MPPDVRVRSHDPGDIPNITAARKPSYMTQEEDRAYRDGQVNERLRGHDEHLARINGSIERTATALEEVARKQDKMGDQMTGILVVMPKIQTIAEQQLAEQTQAEKVAEALRQKTLDEETAWDRWRNKAAWALASAVALVTITNLILRLAGIGG